MPEAKKPKIYTALGLMSGTSLDGVDAAILRTDGETIYGFGPTHSRTYSDPVRAELAAVIKKALEWNFNGPAPKSFALSQATIGLEHDYAITALLDKAELSGGVDIIGFHGQTVLHHPAKDGQKGQSLQLGSGAAMAKTNHSLVAYDFRSADIEAGGQGAPLAPIYHKALCAYSDLSGPIAVVNIGGVSNVTLIDGDKALRATDCGPGNGPLDSWIELHTGKTMDRGGEKSLAGEIDFPIVERWLSRPFFSRPAPRSADRYDFDVLGDLNGMSVEDGAATLASFTAQSIARDVKDFAPQTVIVCGGGRHNQAIMGMLQGLCTGHVVKAEAVGWDGDALEAQAFAYLAVRTLLGLPISFPGTTGVGKAMRGGVIARPQSEEA